MSKNHPNSEYDKLKQAARRKRLKPWDDKKEKVHYLRLEQEIIDLLRNTREAHKNKYALTYIDNEIVKLGIAEFEKKYGEKEKIND